MDQDNIAVSAVNDTDNLICTEEKENEELGETTIITNALSIMRCILYVIEKFEGMFFAEKEDVFFRGKDEWLETIGDYEKIIEWSDKEIIRILLYNIVNNASDMLDDCKGVFKSVCSEKEETISKRDTDFMREQLKNAVFAGAVRINKQVSYIIYNFDYIFQEEEIIELTRYGSKEDDEMLEKEVVWRTLIDIRDSSNNIINDCKLEFPNAVYRIRDLDRTGKYKGEI